MDEYELNWDGSTKTPAPVPGPVMPAGFDDLFETNWDGSSK